MKTIHFHLHSNTHSLLEGNNVPFGFAAETHYEQKSAAIVPGEILLLYSDGITEARNKAGIFFGEDRLMDCIRDNSHHGPETLLDCIHESVVAFTGSEIFTDDLTCAAVKLEDDRGEAPTSKAVLELPGNLENLDQVRDFTRKFCAQCSRGGPNEKITGELELAIHETVANIIKHAHESGNSIRIEAECFHNRLRIRLYYHGRPFSPEKPATLPEDEYSESGYGQFIIENYADSASYTRNANGVNCITLEKYK